MYKISNCVLILIASILLLKNTFLHASPLSFSKVFDGQATGVIWAVEVDDTGIWLGTENGLFGLVGNKTIVINNKNGFQKHSLVSDLEAITDSEYWLTVAGDGLYTFNVYTRKVEKLNLGITDEFNVWSISADQHFVVVNTVRDLHVFDKSTYQKIFSLSDLVPDGLNHITDVRVDDDEVWWIDENEGLKKVSVSERQTSVYSTANNFSELSRITSFLVDENTVIVAGDSAIYSLSRSEDLASLILKRKSTSQMPLRPIYELKRDREGKLWVAAERLFVLDEATQELTVPKALYPVMGSAAVEIVLDMDFDSKGNLYGADTQRGLFYLPAKANGISIVGSVPEQMQRNYSDTYFMSPNNIALGSIGRLTIHNVNTKRTRHIPLPSESFSFILKADDAIAYIIDEKGTFFKVDNHSGIILDSKNLMRGIDGFFSVVDVVNLPGGKAGILVTTSYGRELLLFKDGLVTSVLKGEVERLGVSTDGALLAAVVNNGVFKSSGKRNNYSVSKISEANFSGASCVYEDDSATLWICSPGDGLITQRQGALPEDVSYFPFDYIRGIRQFSNDIFIVATNSGLFSLDVKNQSYIRIHNNFGITDIDFEYDAIFDSELYAVIRGDKFTYVVNKLSFLSNINSFKQEVNHVMIIGLKAYDDNQGRYQSINHRLSQTGGNNEIFLNASESFVAMNLAIPNYIEHEHLSFEYRLRGLSEQWSTNKSSSSNLIFSSLAHGNYLFETRVKSDASSQPVTSLKIKVLPPWWLSPAAYAFYTLVVGVLAGYLIIWAYRQYSKQGQALKGQVKEKQTALESTNVYIRAMLERKQQLFVNVSHELQTPLTLITGPIQQIIANPDDADNSRRLQTINTNAQRLHALVNQILEIERLETLKDRPRQAYQLASFLPSFLANLASLAELHEQSLVSRIRAKGTINLVSDSLEKILFNLVSNAVKYSPPGAAIEVDIRCRDLQLVIVVTDSGPGMTEQEAALIFERFSRLPDAETTHGWGIGLALVKELVNANTGWIGIDTAPGKGARFSVYLPLLVLDEKAGLPVTPPDPIDTPPSVLQQANDTQQPVVLVVDDNEPLRDYLTDILTTEYCCLEAGDAKSALDLMHTIQPALVICDYRMPETSGVELRRQMLQSPTLGAIPFILMAAVNDDVPPTLSRDANIDMLVAKPLNITQLQHALSSLLSLQQRYQSHPATPVLPSAPFSVPNFANAREQAFYTRFLTLLADHFQDEDFGRALASSKMAISERQLSRKLNTLFGLNFTDVLRTYRLHQAKTMLQQGRQVTQVAYDVGFGTPSYFSSCFKAEINETPRQYQERHQQVYAGSV